ncbi:MAG: ATP-binding protein [Synergistaceae bacterium]|nr:ATP-binding protein [Synergistaceae bacterium]
MKRNGILVQKKYLEYLSSTMAFTLSIYIASIVDGLLVGRLIGPGAFTAINLTMPVVCIKNILFCLFISGGSVLVSQFMGARRFDDCNQTFTLSLAGGVAFSIVLAIIGISVSGRLADLLDKSGTFAGDVYSYLVPLWALWPLTMLTSGTASFMRLEGWHGLAAAIPIFANVINLLCDIVFIRFFGWGINGAGWATVTGYGAAVVLLLPYLRSKTRRLHFVRPSQDILKRLVNILRVGLPISLIDACDMLRIYTINSTMIALLGNIGGQVIAVCTAAKLYAIMLANGAATAMTNVVGALYGEQDRNGVLHVLKISLCIASATCIAVFILLELFPVQFAGFYRATNPELLEVLVPWLRIYSLVILVIGPLYILRAFYQSTGQVNAATALSVLEGAGFMIPIFYLLSKISVNAMAYANLFSAALAIIAVSFWMHLKAKKQGLDNFLMLRSSMIHKSWEASIACTEQEAVKASQALLEYCQQNSISSRVANAVSISAEELCVNITRFSGLRPDEQIDLLFKVFDDSVVLKVRDSGKLFNPTEYMDDGKLITGLKLIRAIATKIEYSVILGFNTTVLTVKSKL